MFQPYYPFGATAPTATQPYGFPLAPQMTIPQTSAAQNLPNTNKLFVSGIEEVRAKQLPFDSEYIFLDNDKSIIYQKKVDSKGQFEVQAFDIVPRAEKQLSASADDLTGTFVSRTEFDDLKAKIEGLIEKKGAEA